MNALRAIIGPSPATIEAFQILDILLQFFLRVFAIINFQSQVGKNSKPEPIRVRHPANKND
jgi:hypothetical protein